MVPSIPEIPAGILEDLLAEEASSSSQLQPLRNELPLLEKEEAALLKVCPLEGLPQTWFPKLAKSPMGVRFVLGLCLSHFFIKVRLFFWAWSRFYLYV